MSARPYIRTVFAEDQSEAILTYKATNTLTATFFSAFPWLFSLMLFALGIASIANGSVAFSFVFFAVAVGIVWLARWIFWRPKTYRFRFDVSGFETGGQYFAYSDIASYGISAQGGDPYDPASMRVPRNITNGPHLYVVLKSDSRQRPVTVGLAPAQVRPLADEFDHVFRVFSGERPED